MEFNAEAFVKNPITALRKITGFSRYSKKNKKISSLSDKLDREEAKQTQTQHNVAIGGVAKTVLNAQNKAEQKRLAKINTAHSTSISHQFSEPPKPNVPPVKPVTPGSTIPKPPTTSSFFNKHLSKLKTTLKRPFGVR